MAGPSQKQQHDACHGDRGSKDRSDCQMFSSKDSDRHHEQLARARQGLGDTDGGVFEGELLEPDAEVGAEEGGDRDGDHRPPSKDWAWLVGVAIAEDEAQAQDGAADQQA